MRDLRFAVRRLLAAPGFLFAAVLTLALGIGANTLTFSAIRGLLLRPLPFPEAGRLVWVQAENRAQGIAGERVGGDEVNVLANRVAAFQSVATIGDRSLVREAGDRPVQWHGLWVTPSLFPLLGVTPAAGRALSLEDLPKGTVPAMMMSYERWQRDFQGSTAVIGSVVRFADNKSFTVVGVLPRGLEFPFGRMPQTGNGSGFSVGVQDFWILGQERPGEIPGGMMLARLRAGATTAGAAADATAAVASKAGRSFHVVSLRDQALGMLRPALPLLQGFAAFVLLIACANLANLMLARAAKSRSEFAVRAALGARAGDLLRIVIAESVVLAAGGGACGVALAWIGRKAFVAMAADRVAMAGQVQLDGAVLLFALLLCFATTLLFGAVPAGIVWNEASRAMLARGRTHTAGRGHARALKGLVVSQVALTVVLLTGAALLLQSLTRLMSVDAGYQRGRVIAADVLLYEPARVVYPFFMKLHERLRGLPGVEAVGLIQSTPLTGKWTFHEPMIVTGRTVEGAGSFVGLDYFDAMGIPVIEGRAFQPRDFQNSKLPHVVINDVAARVLFPRETAVGRMVEMFGERREIVGVVKGTRDARLDAPAEPQWYQPILFGGSQLVVRMSGDPAASVEMLRRELVASDPRLMVKRVEPLEAIVADSVFERRLAARLLAVFAGLALALALVGLYGVLNVATVERRREFGVRAALGARPGTLTAMVLREGLAITAAGVGIGMLLSLWFSILLRTMLFEIRPGDPATLVGIAAAMLGAAAAACWLTAWRAASVDPAIALRAE